MPVFQCRHLCQAETGINGYVLLIHKNNRIAKAGYKIRIMDGKQYKIAGIPVFQQHLLQSIRTFKIKPVKRFVQNKIP